MAVVSQKMYETHHFTMFNVIITINCEEVESQPVLIEELQSMIPKVFNGSLGPSFWILASHISLYVGLKRKSGIIKQISSSLFCCSTAWGFLHDESNEMKYSHFFREFQDDGEGRPNDKVTIRFVAICCLWQSHWRQMSGLLRFRCWRKDRKVFCCQSLHCTLNHLAGSGTEGVGCLSSMSMQIFWQFILQKFWQKLWCLFRNVMTATCHLRRVTSDQQDITLFLDENNIEKLKTLKVEPELTWSRISSC